MSNVFSEQATRHDLQTQWEDRRKEAYLYKKLGNGKVQCHLCPRQCQIAENSVGFCKVRKNMGGKLYAQSYGKATHITVERVETEATFHYMPGAKILSLGNFGCNLDCDYCQNWVYSQLQYTPPSTIYEYSTQQVIDTAKSSGNSHSFLDIQRSRRLVRVRHRHCDRGPQGRPEEPFQIGLLPFSGSGVRIVQGHRCVRHFDQGHGS